MSLDINSIIVYLACIIFLFLIGKFFIFPIKVILKIIGNSIIGAIIILVVNLIGSIWNFHIGLNIITAIVVGILGIPRSNFINYFENHIIIVEKNIIICYNSNK
ncbi:MAG: SigmaK-factor processing regulatory BofA [Clostridiaceae bacterium]|nr:SigmaK-factor processing regulatory BofA [Clostridiaceae bacterium]